MTNLATPKTATPVPGPVGAPQALDPTIVNLAKAIRQTETGESSDPYTAKGGSGEFGAYQYTPDTWAADVKKYTGQEVPLAQADKLLQNEVAYKKLVSLKGQGYNVGQIASIWNSGGPDWQGKVGTNKFGVQYDTPAYVNKVANAYQEFKLGQNPDAGTPTPTAPTIPAPQPTLSQQQDTSNAQQNGALFPSSSSDNGLTAGLKTLGNLLPSAWNFAKGAVESLNPVTIAKNLSQIPSAFSSLVQQQGGVGNALGAFGKQLLPTAYNQLVPQAGQDLISAAGGAITGNSAHVDQSLQDAQRNIVNNPFGSIAPFVLGAKGLAEGVDSVTSKAAEANMHDYVNNPDRLAAGETIPTRTGTNFGPAVDSTISKIASPITTPLSAFGSAVADNVPKIGRYAFGQATGLEPSTISTIADNPEAFSKENMGTITRPALGDTIKTALDTRIDNLSETGTGYDAIRSSDAPVAVDKTFLKDAISKEAGVKFDAGGKIQTSGSAAVRQAADVTKLQKLYDFWQPYFDAGKMTNEEFLNFRSDLAKMANYEGGIGKSVPLENVGAGVRESLNTTYRGKISGLENTDADYSSQITELKNLKKGILDKNNELTDGAVNKIANALGKGKDQLIARLEEISPGITKQIQILKAAEDLERAGGNKVGTYTRSTLGSGGLVAGAVTGNIAVMAASLGEMILANPEVARTIIRAYGSAKPLMLGVAKFLRKGAVAVNNAPQTMSTPLQASSVFGRPATPQLTQ